MVTSVYSENVGLSASAAFKDIMDFCSVFVISRKLLFKRKERRRICLAFGATV